MSCFQLIRAMRSKTRLLTSKSGLSPKRSLILWYVKTHLSPLLCLWWHYYLKRRFCRALTVLNLVALLKKAKQTVRRHWAAVVGFLLVVCKLLANCRATREHAPCKFWIFIFLLSLWECCLLHSYIAISYALNCKGLFMELYHLLICLIINLLSQDLILKCLKIICQKANFICKTYKWWCGNKQVLKIPC